jgi:hypothetical protein
MPDNISNDEELRRFVEQGMPGVWHLCPRCMSKEVWLISLEYKKKPDQNHESFKSSIIGSICEKCKFYEVDPDMIMLGMDRIDWNLVAKEKKIF